MKYTILTSSNPEDLSIAVREAADIGLYPLGGVAVSSRIGGDVFHQSVSDFQNQNSENQISKTEIPNSKLENENSKIEKENLEFDFEDKKPVRKKRRKKSKVVRKKK